MNTNVPARLRRFPLWGGGVLGVAVGVFVFTLVWSGTREFWGTQVGSALIFFVPLWLVTVLAVSAVFLVLSWLVTRSKLTRRKQWWLLLTPWGLAMGFWLGVAGLSATPQSRFRSVVFEPVPVGVHNIRAAGFNAFLASRWLMQFEIEANDLLRIVSRHDLVEVEPFDLPALLQQDGFLARLEGAGAIPGTKPARFFSRKREQGLTGVTIFLVYDPATTQAWFVWNYQN